MRAFKAFVILMTLTWVAGCHKDEANQGIVVPNGDFEDWVSSPAPQLWQTNSCPLCLPPYETYIVQQDTNAYQGSFAAKIIANGVYQTKAENKFAIPYHPTVLSAYVKSGVTTTDSLLISIKLLRNAVTVDSGQWINTASIAGYTKINIPITNNATLADSASIKITGGKNRSTVLWIDYVTLQ